MPRTNTSTTLARAIASSPGNGIQTEAFSHASPCAMIRILIADDHAVVRAGIRQFIAGHEDLSVVGEASNGAEVLDYIRQGEMDVVVLDISMPGRSGVDILRSLKRVRPELPVLILSGFAENLYAVNLLRAGAAGYVSKDAAATQLVAAIRMVSKGRKYVSPAVAQLLADGLSIKDQDQPVHSKLSQREFQIFCKLAKGQGVSKIAEELFLSVKTGSTYRGRILDKTGMKTNADLTYYAIKNELIN